jgi:very-short-patch-repair endonuclease
MFMMLKAERIIFVREHRFHSVRRWRFDFAIPHQKIAIEIEGGIYTQGRHTRGSGFSKDCEKYNTATVMGWAVLRFPANEVGADSVQYIKELIRCRNESTDRGADTLRER